MACNLAIGTAQFGGFYGVANRVGAVTGDEAKRILGEAFNSGVDVIDTAPSYGRSEELAGEMCDQIDGFKVVSKVMLSNSPTEIQIEQSIRSSVKKVGKPLYAMLVHNIGPMLLDKKMVYKALNSAKQNGLVNKIGVSAGSPAQVQELINYCDIDLIQIPINLLDQRFITSGVLNSIKGKGIEIHARSIFLQGLLLDKTPNKYFSPILGAIENINIFAREHGISVCKLALEFSKRIGARNIIVGVESIKQLNEIVQEFNSTDCPNDIDFSKFMITDEQFLDPFRWPIGGYREV